MKFCPQFVYHSWAGVMWKHFRFSFLRVTGVPKKRKRYKAWTTEADIRDIVWYNAGGRLSSGGTKPLFPVSLLRTFVFNKRSPGDWFRNSVQSYTCIATSYLGITRLILCSSCIDCSPSKPSFFRMWWVKRRNICFSALHSVSGIISNLIKSDIHYSWSKCCTEACFCLRSVFCNPPAVCSLYV